MLFHNAPAGSDSNTLLRYNVACLLNIPYPEDVPDASDAPTELMDKIINSFYRRHSTQPIHIPFVTDSIDNVMTLIRLANSPDITYILTGLGAHGLEHGVICQGDKIVHDVSAEKYGIVGPFPSTDLLWASFAGNYHNVKTKQTGAA